MSKLNPNPDIPEYILDNAEKNKIIPVTTMFISGDVIFKGLGSQNLIDIGFGGEHDIVFDIITSEVNRFAIDNEQGEDFVIGWLYKIENESDITVHIREDVKNKYSLNLYSNNPVDINKKYDAYENV